MSKAKDKGRRFENEVADKLTERGIPATRVPLSGSFGGAYDCDVKIGTPEHPIADIECKYRENISKELWAWLEGNDFLAVRRNHHEALVVMTLERFIELYKDATEAKQETHKNATI